MNKSIHPSFALIIIYLCTYITIFFDIFSLLDFILFFDTKCTYIYVCKIVCKFHRKLYNNT